MSAQQAKDYGLVDEVVVKTIKSLGEPTAGGRTRRRADDGSEECRSAGKWTSCLPAFLSEKVGDAAGEREGSREVERCVFCGKSAKLVERLIAGPPNIYICNECVELCHSILSEDDRRRTSKSPLRLDEIPTPHEMKKKLDEYVIGQDTRRRCSRSRSTTTTSGCSRRATRDEVELEKSNVLMIGPTGSGRRSSPARSRSS